MVKVMFTAVLSSTKYGPTAISTSVVDFDDVKQAQAAIDRLRDTRGVPTNVHYYGTIISDWVA